MQDTLKRYIPIRLLQEEFAVIDAIAKSERRKHSDTIRLLLEDVASGALPVDFSDKSCKEKRYATSLRVSDSTFTNIEALRAKTGLSVEKILRLAIAELAKSLPSAQSAQPAHQAQSAHCNQPAEDLSPPPLTSKGAFDEQPPS